MRTQNTLRLLQIIRLKSYLPNSHRLHHLSTQTRHYHHTPISNKLKRFIPRPTFQHIKPKETPLHHYNKTSHLIRQTNSLQSISRNITLNLHSITHNRRITTLHPSRLRRPTTLTQTNRSCSSTSHTTQHVSHSTASTNLIFRES